MNEEDKFSLGWGKGSLSASGPVTTIVLLVICLAIVNGGMILYHHWGIGALHQAMTDGLKKLEDAQNETTYIHTLTDAEKQELCLTMPASLREKIKQNGGRHTLKRC